MQLRREVVDDVAVASFAEPTDVCSSNASDFRAALLGAHGRDTWLVLDASRVRTFDSEGMGALLAIRKHFVARGGGLVLARLNRLSTQVFRMVGFDVVFLIRAEVADAVRAVQRRRGPGNAVEQ